MKVVVGIVVAVIVVVLLFTVVFPWVDRTFLADPVMQSAYGAWTPSRLGG